MQRQTADEKKEIPKSKKFNIIEKFSSDNATAGQILQEGRVRLGSSIDQISVTTKIKKNFIEAPTKILPDGRVYFDAYYESGYWGSTVLYPGWCEMYDFDATGAAAIPYPTNLPGDTQGDLQLSAMVTAPLNKEAVTLSGRAFSGHTEFIAELTGAAESRMLLFSEKLATVHVSTHVSLEQACQLDQQRIVRTIQLGNDALQFICQRPPRIAVSGLNPHAGEHGLFGAQDAAIIAPAIAEARALGIDCTGPYPPDTVFVRGLRGEFDLVVAMYHDQGHIPMKLVDFEGTVNVSLGMPILRTSVDHGTAFDIAGRNIADPANMKAAMRLAVRMAAGKLVHAAANKPSAEASR